jgi:uncharacterized oxidoreductase
MPTLSAAQLTDLAQRLFEATGVPATAAATVARSLVDSNLCGHDSHGVIRIPQYVQGLQAGLINANAEWTLLHETPAALAVDANWGLGQVQAHRLLAGLIPKAQVLGVAIGTLRRCGHIGRLGEYAEVAAQQQLALFATVNNHGHARRVAPPGGTEPRISTNPLCLGAPTHTDPLVLDIGTSVCAEGKVRVYHQKGERVPEGWLLDPVGQPTTDPSVLYTEPRGSILPLGGPQAYKGFGLGLLLDAWAGGLTGGACSRADDPADPPRVGGSNAVVFVVINPAQLGGVEHFLTQTTALSDFVRSSKPQAGTGPVTLPGDPERTVRHTRQQTGISLPDGTWKLLSTTAQQLGVPMPVV